MKILNGVPSHKFGTNACQLTWKGQAKFAVQSLIGKAVAKKRRTPASALLQVGSGEHPHASFENMDFYFPARKGSGQVGHDLRAPLPYDDDAFEGAFSEHTLEHLYPSDAIKLIGEIHRVLEPGGIFRCVVPDLDKYVDFYNGKLPNEDFKQYDSGCEAMWCLTQNWFHQSVWNADMIVRQMLAAGFSSARKRAFREGDDERLLIDLPERAWESVYVEGVK